MKTFITLIFLAHFLPLAAQPDSYAHYSGKLGSDMIVNANIQVIDSKLFGTYYYQIYSQDKQIKESPLIILKGELKNGNYFLYERDDMTSFFEGRTDAAGNFLSGSWNFAGRQVTFKWKKNYTGQSVALSKMELKRQKTLSQEAGSPKAIFDAIIFYPPKDNLRLYQAYISFIKKMLKSKDAQRDLFTLLAIYKDDFFDTYYENNIGKYSNGTRNGLSWQQKIRSRIYLNDKNILSMLFTQKVNTGGSTQLEMNYTANFDTRDGREIRYNTLFTASFQSPLKRLIEQKLRSDFQVEDEQKFTDIGFLTDDIPLASNYLLTNKGVLFIYNVYELAGNDFGKIEVFLSYQELNPLLRKKQ
jgi:hypothetical protein